MIALNILRLLTTSNLQFSVDATHLYQRESGLPIGIRPTHPKIMTQKLRSHRGHSLQRLLHILKIVAASVMLVLLWRYKDVGVLNSSDDVMIPNTNGVLGTNGTPVQVQGENKGRPVRQTSAMRIAHIEAEQLKRKKAKDMFRMMAYKRAVESKGKVILNSEKFGLVNHNFVTSDCYIYRKGVWDGSPIVVEKYKLIFFTIPKVGCTVFKQLFRRMANIPNWIDVGKDGLLPHLPSKNGLKYLHSYDIPTATEMLKSSEWTRAIFLRDPKERFLSAYLDKAVRDKGDYVNIQCCPDCGKEAATVEGFLGVMKHCVDPHWMPQAHRMEDRFWETIDFVGHIETAAVDTRVLLERLGAWEEFGSSGWGITGNESIFQSISNVKHSTKADKYLREYFDKNSEALVEEFYKDDYSNEMFHFEKRTSVNS